MTLEAGMTAQAEARNTREAANEERNDRAKLGGIMGHLHIAALQLVEGRISTAEKISHEIKKIMHLINAKLDEAYVPDSLRSYTPAPGELTLPNPQSVEAWSRQVEHTVSAAKKLYGTTGPLPDMFKKELGAIIKQGRMLSGGSSSVAKDARGRIEGAARLYKELTGPSYL